VTGQESKRPNAGALGSSENAEIATPEPGEQVADYGTAKLGLHSSADGPDGAPRSQWKDLYALVFSNGNRRASTVAIVASLGLAISETLGIATLYPLLIFLDKGREGLLSELPMAGKVDEALLGMFGVHLNVPILASMILGAFALRQGLNFVRATTVARVGIDTTKRFRSYFFERKVTANVVRDAASGKNETMPFLMEDCFRAGQFAQNGLDFITFSLPLAMFGLALLYMAALPTLVLGAVAGLTALAYKRRMHLGEDLGQELSAQQVQLYWFIDEFISNLRLLRLRSFERQAARKVDGKLERLAEVNYTLVRQRQIMEATSQFVLFAGIILGFLVLVSYLGGDVAQTGVLLTALCQHGEWHSIRFALYAPVAGAGPAIRSAHRAGRSRT
jgi:hypothetical protein